MNQQSEHLSSAQIDEYGSQASAAKPETTEWVEMHLDGCPSCRGRVLESQRTRLALFADANVNTVPTSDCPSEDDLRNLAAGLCSEPIAQKLKSHAATCDHCGPLLREYSEDFSDNFTPEEQAALDQLNSASPKWQRQKAREMLKQARPSPPTPHWTFSWRWALISAATVACALTAVGIWYTYTQRDTQEKVEKLLAQAFTEQRTTEMRFTGSGYAPLRVQRTEHEPQFAKPKSLLEAEFRISERLEKSPMDPMLLKAKAEAELLNSDYKSAITTLEAVLRSVPNSPDLLELLGIAYYESAEHGPQEYRQQEYARALENMSAALRSAPANTSILFNRALLQEKMNFYNESIKDWERFLEIEKVQGWREEAEKHLEDIRKKQKMIHSGWLDDRAPPMEKQFSVNAEASLDPEELLQKAERVVLPSVLRSDSSDPQFKIATAMAILLMSSHHDPFLNDILTAAAQPEFPHAAKLLASASVNNNHGEAETAYQDAKAALRQFQLLGDEAGMAAALFEEAYSLQFQSQANTCVQKAGEALAIAKRKRYHWLEIQSGIELTICLNMLGRLEKAQNACEEAIRLAQTYGFRSFYLRALLERSSVKADGGDEAGALSDSYAGLNEYFKGGISAIRAYSFYDLISDIAGRAGLKHVKLSAALEQTKFLSENPNLEVVASARLRIANIALDLAEPAIAEEQFSEAARIISSLQKTDSVRWRLLEANIGLARAHLSDPKQRVNALTTLRLFSNQLPRIHNRFVEQNYFSTLGEIQQASGETQEAIQALKQAIKIAESEKRSAKSLNDALNWAEQNTRPYLLLTQLLFDSEQTAQALEVWKKIRSAPFSGKADSNTSVHHQEKASWPSDTSRNQTPTTISYAVAPDQILIWVSSENNLRGQKVSISRDRFYRIAARFIEECSRPDSNIDDLQADSHLLYQWLIQPIRNSMPPSGEIDIRPDGILQLLPWEALLDDSGQYLLEHYVFVLLPTFDANPMELRLSTKDKALIVATPGVEEADSEAVEVARQFSAPTMLPEQDVNLHEFEREIAKHSVLHFSGHAVQRTNGPALVLVDGVFDPSAMAEVKHTTSERYLANLKLAVFSACSTAGGGYGNRRTGELVAEFLASGTKNVIASRWNVDSHSTREFMATFYQKLVGEGVPLSRALQAAEKAMAEDLQHSHPYYWAGFGQFTRS